MQKCLNCYILAQCVSREVVERDMILLVKLLH